MDADNVGVGGGYPIQPLPIGRAVVILRRALVLLVVVLACGILTALRNLVEVSWFLRQRKKRRLPSLSQSVKPDKNMIKKQTAKTIRTPRLPPQSQQLAASTNTSSTSTPASTPLVTPLGLESQQLPTPTFTAVSKASSSDRTNISPARNARDFPTYSEAGLDSPFQGADITEYLEAFDDSCEDFELTDNQKYVKWLRWCHYDYKQQVRAGKEDLGEPFVWEDFKKFLNDQWGFRDPHQKERPLEALRRFYNRPIDAQPPSILNAINQHGALLAKLKADERAHAKTECTRHFYNALDPVVKANIRQRKDKSDEEVMEIPWETFRPWILRFAQDGYILEQGQVARPNPLSPLSGAVKSIERPSRLSSLPDKDSAENFLLVPAKAAPGAPSRGLAKQEARDAKIEDGIQQLTEQMAAMKLALLHATTNVPAQPGILRSKQPVRTHVNTQRVAFEDDDIDIVDTLAMRTRERAVANGSGLYNPNRRAEVRCYCCGFEGHSLPQCAIYNEVCGTGLFHQSWGESWLGPHPGGANKPSPADKLDRSEVEDMKRDHQFLDYLIAKLASVPNRPYYQTFVKWYCEVFKPQNPNYVLNWELIGQTGRPEPSLDDPYGLRIGGVPPVKPVQVNIHKVANAQGRHLITYPDAKDIRSHEWKRDVKTFVQLVEQPLADLEPMSEDGSEEEAEQRKALVLAAKRRRVEVEDAEEEEGTRDVPSTLEDKPTAQANEEDVTQPPVEEEGATSKTSTAASSTGTEAPKRKGTAPTKRINLRGPDKDGSAPNDVINEWIERIMTGKSRESLASLLELCPPLRVALVSYLEDDSAEPIIVYKGSAVATPDEPKSRPVKTNVLRVSDREKMARYTTPAISAVAEDGELRVYHDGLWKDLKAGNLTPSALGDLNDRVAKTYFQETTSIGFANTSGPYTRLTSLPSLYINIDNPDSRKVLALLDSGSECNVISIRLAKALGLPIRETKVQSQGINGVDPVPFLGETVVPLFLCEKKLRVHFFISQCDVANHDMLLGMPFFMDSRLNWLHSAEEEKERRIIAAKVSFEGVRIIASVVVGDPEPGQWV